ncbi:MAG TPA: DNA polymerase III subunit alpha [Xanthomonadaceae bacterium]|nr:DNA polymerase III subunit alpha [Xanthomonadaceae bacterium]
MSASFVHLQLHSEYSLRDSTIRINALVRRCVELGLPAVALTDPCNLFALVKFYRAAEAAGVKPIAGADLLIAEADAPPSRLTVLCQHVGGYRTLSRLLTRAYRDGHEGDQVVLRRQWLEADNSGLIALLGRDSDAGRLALEGRLVDAEHALAAWQRRFDDRLCLALTRTQRTGESEFVTAALELGARRAVPAVAGNDVRFLERSDFEAHEARVCIASGRVLADPRRPREYSQEQYLKSPAEMAEVFADLPQAVENTLALAQRCNLEMTLGRYSLPAFPVPKGQTLDSHLRESAATGLQARLSRQSPAPGHTRQDYEQRLGDELEVIVSMGFPGYFLIVADFINWAKRQSIPVGPGRGSGAGSLVAWALGITDLDPLRHDLLFERFLNPERVSLPDFDIDFCMDRRDEVIEYVAEKYGRTQVSQIITFGTMAAKAVLRDVGRVLGHPYGFVDSIAKLIPNVLGIGLEDALGESERAARDPAVVSAELAQRVSQEEDVRELIELARKLEDLPRNAGKHAGGVVIAPSDLTDFTPLYCEAGGRGAVTQFDKDDVESAGLVKFDFLGLRTLTIIDWAVTAINARRRSTGEPAIDMADLPMDDPATFALLRSCRTTAVFQLESRGMKELLRKLQPDSFEEIVALVALFRPGPLQSGMVDDFIARKHGQAQVSYVHPKLEPILKPTYGVIVYQEQVMQIAQVLSGYSLGGADLLRRAMGKKKPDEMAKERVKFETGAAERGIEARVASSIFDLMEKFAEYGFNKSHSAAYALVSYQTAWLKAHYPAQFMAAVLSSDMDNTDKVVVFLREAVQMALQVLPPDVNASRWMFEAIDDGRIRYGLGAVKGVGHGAVESILAAREENGAFTDLFGFCCRIDPLRLNRRAIEALILSGSMDALAANRATSMAQLPEVLRAAEQLAREREAGQDSLFGEPGTQRSPVLPPQLLAEVPDWPLPQRLAGERDTLGHYLSGHPIDPYRDLLQPLVHAHLGELDTVAGVERRNRNGEPVVLAGIVGAVRRRGDAMAFVQLEDGHGRVEVALFREAALEFGPLLTRDRILIVEGGLSEDEFSGGYTLRARRIWDLAQVCAEHARRLDLTVDQRQGDALAAIDAALSRYRPGPTPLRIELIVHGSRGALEVNGAAGIRPAPELLPELAALPGVREVRLSVRRPWIAERG